MDTLVNFLGDHSFVSLAIAAIGIFFIIGLVKSLLRLVMVVAVIGLVMVVFFDFESQEVVDKGKSLAGIGTEVLEENVKPFLVEQLLDDDFLIQQENGDTVVELNNKTYKLDELLDRVGHEEQLNELLDQLNEDDKKLVEEWE
ncbi:hypothetical protein [Aquibacillus sediminis]|uniref:hypothetical protein n=1 Tax=Aquibacillus sediminis TaxID=2574734 RepID=UPI0011095D8D|nr:hypothetical protein [Aquibacillus sediminis]